MRLLLTSTLLAGIFLPMAPSLGQSVINSDGTLSGPTDILPDGSLFSATDTPLLRGSEEAGTPVVVVDDPKRVTPQSGRIDYPVGPVQPVDPVAPVAPVQGSGRRSAQTLGPYDPQGIRLGSFLLYPSLTLFAVATDNVDNSATKTKGTTGRAEVQARLESQWDRHSLAVEGRAGVTGYRTPDRDSDTDQYLNGELRLDLADRTSLTLTGRVENQREAAGSVELAASGSAADEQLQLNGSANLDHSVGLLQLQLRGAIGSERYKSDIDRNFNTYTAGTRLGYRMTDQVIPFVDLEFSRKRYAKGTSTQDGDNWRGAIGIEVRNRQTVSGQISVGAMAWRPALSGEKKDEIFFADASVTWTPNEIWTLTGGLETSLTSSSTAATSVSTHQVNGSVDFAARENLDFNANGSLALESYNGSEREDIVFDATFGAEYSFNRNVQLIARAGHERRISNESGAGFASNRIELGLKFQR